MNRKMIESGGYTVGYRRSSWHAFMEFVYYLAIVLMGLLATGLLIVGAWVAYIFA